MVVLGSRGSEESASLKGILQSWREAAGAAKASNNPCIYQGLQQLSPSQQNMAVGLRCGGLALWIACHALPASLYPDLVNFVDSWWPGELGECNHSKMFVSRQFWGRIACFFPKSLSNYLLTKHRTSKPMQVS